MGPMLPRAVSRQSLSSRGGCYKCADAGPNFLGACGLLTLTGQAHAGLVTLLGGSRACFTTTNAEALHITVCICLIKGPDTATEHVASIGHRGDKLGPITVLSGSCRQACR